MCIPSLDRNYDFYHILKIFVKSISASMESTQLRTEAYFLLDLPVYQIWCQSDRNYDFYMVFKIWKESIFTSMPLWKPPSSSSNLTYIYFY